MKQAPAFLALTLFAVAPASADDKADVIAVTEMWKNKLAEACASEPTAILPLYAEDGVLWGTLSQKIRSDRAGMQDYFVAACKALPKLTVEFTDQLIRVYGGDTAINSGSYTLTYEKDGQMVKLPARYSFTLVKRDDRWIIVDHHSSTLPQ